MEAEEERKRKEAEELERLRLEEIEKNFDKEGELRRLGGKVYDFYVDDGKNHGVNDLYRDKKKPALRMVYSNIL